MAGSGRRAEEVLHGLNNAAVEGLTFAGQELGVDGLPGQGVPEGEPFGRLLDEQVHTNELIHAAE